jgi:hypothetical protein
MPARIRFAASVHERSKPRCRWFVCRSLPVGGYELGLDATSPAWASATTPSRTRDRLDRKSTFRDHAMSARTYNLDTAQLGGDRVVDRKEDTMSKGTSMKKEQKKPKKKR